MLPKNGLHLLIASDEHIPLIMLLVTDLLPDTVQYAKNKIISAKCPAFELKFYLDDSTNICIRWFLTATRKPSYQAERGWSDEEVTLVSYSFVGGD